MKSKHTTDPTKYDDKHMRESIKGKSLFFARGRRMNAIIKLALGFNSILISMAAYTAIRLTNVVRTAPTTTLAPTTLIFVLWAGLNIFAFCSLWRYDKGEEQCQPKSQT